MMILPLSVAGVPMHISLSAFLPSSLNSGCTQRRAAEVLGLSSGAAVSIQLKKLQGQLKSDKSLRVVLERLKQRLGGIDQ